MFLFKHGTRQVLQAVSYRTPTAKRFASKISIPFQQPSVPIIETCPAPTCQCRESPPGLDIEREQNINGSMAAYAEQILICTGKEDWKSRIEDEEDAVLVNQLKKNLTRGGKYVDVRGIAIIALHADRLCIVDLLADETCCSDIAVPQRLDHKLVFSTFKFSRRAYSRHKSASPVIDIVNNNIRLSSAFLHIHPTNPHRQPLLRGDIDQSLPPS